MFPPKPISSMFSPSLSQISLSLSLSLIISPRHLPPPSPTSTVAHLTSHLSLLLHTLPSSSSSRPRIPVDEKVVRVDHIFLEFLKRYGVSGFPTLKFFRKGNKGKKIKCSTSQAKHRLFIGNVPRNWMHEDMKKVVSKVGPGVTSVQLMKDPQNSSRNRGYAFIEYYNGACAEYSRKKMSSPNFKLDDNVPAVSWADLKTVDSASNSQIKSVYVKHLPKNVTQDQLKKLFDRHGKITMVVLPPAKPWQENRIGFVHFAEKSSAMKALENTEI